MPDFDEKNRLGGLYPASYCGPRESLKPEPILMTTGSRQFDGNVPLSVGVEKVSSQAIISTMVAPSHRNEV